MNTLIYLGNRIIKSDVNFGLANQEMIYAQQFLTTSKEVSALLKELLNNLSETKNLANYNKYLTNFSGAISKLSETASMDVSQTNSLIPFMMQMNNAAKQLKILEETINSGDITKAVNKFINDINVLTKEQMDTKMKSSEMSLQSFASQLKVFNHEVSVTNTDVNSFSVSMDRASQAFQKFDKVLIEQEEKRNKALKQFGELIHNIADSVEKLSDKIESLDKNKILENFKGIVDLLKVAESTTGTGTTKTTGNAPATRVVSEQVVTQSAKIFENTIIEFRFDNTHFTGIANQI